jgi:L-ascorbate metabolism protein UlaG (beta-lactamase superfamily)
MRSSKKRAIFVVLLTGLLLTAVLTRCGSVIQGNYTSDGQPFDFAHPRCIAATVEPPLTQVDIRYLGSGGVYIGWGHDAIMTGPFFSNPGVFGAAFGRFESDRERIRLHLRNIPVQKVRAILMGHSHYDHIGDIPVVSQEYAPASLIYANASGVNMLVAYPALRKRLHTVRTNEPILIRDADNREVMRIYPVPSDHAPQLCRWRGWPCEFAHCGQASAWSTPFDEHRMSDFCGGQPYAYVIDLIHEGEVKYRIYYNDAAAQPPLGVPDAAFTGPRPYDIAIICLPSYDFVRDYPEALLSYLKPRHLILGHYENFFSRSEGHWRFVPLLTNSKANAFFQRLQQIDYQADPLPPVTKPCGVSADRWTMPVPDGQMIFDRK